MRAAIRWAVVSVAAAGLWFGHVPRTTAKSSTKTIEKNLLKAAKSHVKYLRGALADKYHDFCHDLNDIDGAVYDGELSEFGAWYAIGDLVDSYLYCLDGLHETVVSTMEGNERDMLNEFVGDALGPYVFKGSLIGDCGAIDYLHDNLDVMLDDFADDMRSKLKDDFGTALDSGDDDYGFCCDCDGPVFRKVAPYLMGQTAPPSAVLRLLNVDALMSIGKLSDDADGRLFVGGTADPADGTVIQVMLYRPDGQTVLGTTTVDVVRHRWKIRFPPTADVPGTLIRGNYRIDVGQGNFRFSTNFGVN